MILLSKRGSLILLCSLSIMILLVLSTVNVSGLGVTPSRVVLRYVPNYLYENDVCFIPEGVNHLKLEVEGELNKSIKLETEVVFIIP